MALTPFGKAQSDSGPWAMNGEFHGPWVRNDGDPYPANPRNGEVCYNMDKAKAEMYSKKDNTWKEQ